MRRQVTQFTAAASARNLLRGAATMLMLTALAGSVPAVAAAQASLGFLQKGDRIRISSASSGSSPRTGRLVAASEDTIVVQTNENGRMVTQTIPRTEITRLDVSMGAGGSHSSQFAGIGFFVGAGIAQLIPRGSSQEMVMDFDALADGLLLGGLGAAIGAYIGRAQEDWRRVPLGAAQVSLRHPQSGRGIGVGATIAF